MTNNRQKAPTCRPALFEFWVRTSYFAWSFFGDQYQIWDKHTGDFHWEQGPLVANYNLNTKQGHAYRNGADISATPAGQKLLGEMPSTWINNAYWLLMPFKLKDSGVTLTYKVRAPAKPWTARRPTCCS